MVKIAFIFLFIYFFAIVRRLCETMIDIGLKDNTINRRLSEKTISMLDFAGQCGYYASHHIYFNRRSFFILVTDLTKSLDSVVEDTGNEGTIFEQWTYKGNQFFFLSQDVCSLEHWTQNISEKKEFIVIKVICSSYNHLTEFVLFWMKSIHTYSSESAPVILVWTHADKVENAVTIDL